MSDFVSQSSFARDEKGQDGLRLPVDKLGHEALASSLIQRARQLPAGSVIALQGSWGRGKTDVLARVARKTYDDDPPAKVAGRAIWVNPWQYGTPDLLSPLIIELYKRLPKEGVSSKDVKNVVTSLMRAGLSFGIKSASLSVPAAPLVDLAAQKGLDLLELERTGKGPGVDLDPVAKMAENFRRLTNMVLSPEEIAAGARLLVCVDDLDRCLPDRQVALLQALRFLTSSGAPVTLLVGIDPTLARQAVFAHYRTERFDPDRYLDKMFHLRLNMPAVGPQDLTGLMEGHMAREILLEVGHAKLGELLEKNLGGGVRALVDHAGSALSLTDLRNPRVVQRIVTKLEVLATSETGLGALSGEEGRLLLTWLGLSERWPAVRAAIQDADEYFVERYREVAARYKRNPADAHVPSKLAVVERLPRPDEAPELCQLFQSVRINDEHAAKSFQRLDEALMRLGL